MASVSSASSLTGSVFGRSVHLTYSVHSYLSFRDGFQDDPLFEIGSNEVSGPVSLDFRTLNGFRRSSVDSRKNLPFLVRTTCVKTSSSTDSLSVKMKSILRDQKRFETVDFATSLSLDSRHQRHGSLFVHPETDYIENSLICEEGTSQELNDSESPLTPDLRQDHTFGTPTAGRIRVIKDHWRKENRLPDMKGLISENRRTGVFIEAETRNDQARDQKVLSVAPPLTTDVLYHQESRVTNCSDEETKNSGTSSSIAAATEQAIRLVRLAELDRQRILHYSKAPPKDEYSIIEEDIPPYRAQLHRYLDLISYDERFTPILRVNRYLVNTDSELTSAINKFAKFNLLPRQTDLWAISHVDDNEYESMIPALIPESSYYTNEFNSEER